jgi:hypothetical protein
MPEYTQIDHSINEHTVSELHLAKTTPQGTQFEGVLNGHEHRDISVRSISKWFFGLFCFVIVASLGLVWTFFGILRYDAAKDEVPSALYKSSIKPAPLSQAERLIEGEKADAYLPTPTQPLALMPDPHQPMLKLREQENAEVSSYGYVEDAKGKKVGIHIPVQSNDPKVKDAITLALEKGYPVVAAPSSLRPPAPVSPALNPAEDKGF